MGVLIARLEASQQLGHGMTWCVVMLRDRVVVFTGNAFSPAATRRRDQQRTLISTLHAATPRNITSACPTYDQKSPMASQLCKLPGMCAGHGTPDRCPC